MMPQPGMMLSQDEVRILLRLLLKSGGSKAAFCRKHRVHQTHLSNFLSGRRLPGPRILKALGLEERLVYVIRTSTATKP
jgi:hypothetical protein